MIKEKSEETVNELNKHSKALEYELEKKVEEDSRNQFKQIASNLHHLVGTSVIPGVYNNPYTNAYSKATVFNADVETHLKSVFKVNIYILKKINRKIIETMKIALKIRIQNKFLSL